MLPSFRRQIYRIAGGGGRWLAWMMYDVCTPGPGLPAYRTLRWNTRSVESEAQYAHETATADTPAAVIVLWKYTVRRRRGAPITLYRTEVTLRLMVGGRSSEFDRNRSFSSLDAAEADFLRHQANMLFDLRKPVLGVAAQEAT